MLVLFAALFIFFDFFAGKILSRAGLLAASEYLSYYEIYVLRKKANSGEIDAIKRLGRFYGIWKNNHKMEFYWIRKGAELGGL